MIGGPERSDLVTCSHVQLLHRNRPIHKAIIISEVALVKDYSNATRVRNPVLLCHLGVANPCAYTFSSLQRSTGEEPRKVLYSFSIKEWLGVRLILIFLILWSLSGCLTRTRHSSTSERGSKSFGLSKLVLPAQWPRIPYKLSLIVWSCPSICACTSVVLL